MANGILASMSGSFAPLYSDVGRPSIPPEQLFRALLLQILYTVRSERQLMEQMDYNLLFRWFVGLTVDEPVWDASTFSANRERLLNQAMAREFFSQVLASAQWQGLTSDEHFSVDGTLIQAWASHKSFRPKDGGDAPPGTGAVTPRSTSRAKSAATPRTPRPPIRTRGCTARAMQHPRCSAISPTV